MATLNANQILQSLLNQRDPNSMNGLFGTSGATPTAPVTGQEAPVSGFDLAELAVGLKKKKKANMTPEEQAQQDALLNLTGGM